MSDDDEKVYVIAPRKTKKIITDDEKMMSIEKAIVDAAKTKEYQKKYRANNPDKLKEYARRAKCYDR